MAAGGERVARALVVAHALEREAEVSPRAAVAGLLLDDALELAARALRLARLQVREREVDARLDRVRMQAMSRS